MKFLHEYRDRELAWSVAEAIETAVDRTRQYTFLLFSSALSRAVVQHGLAELLPENVRLLHGAGCTSCSLPPARIDQALRLLERGETILCVFPEQLAAIGSDGRSLAAVKAAGADIRPVRTARAATAIAQRNPWRRVVLFAAGLEAQAPGTALALRHARLLGLRNFLVLSNHLLSPPAIANLLAGNRLIDGVIAPGDVACVIGTAPFAEIAASQRRPICISGAEPLDVLQSVLLLIRRIGKASAGVDNQFARAATPLGNRAARNLLAETFAVRESFRWYSLGDIPASALALSAAYAAFDAEQVLPPPPVQEARSDACAGGEILRGLRSAGACPLFGQGCTPDAPLGPCMTAPETPCGAHWQAVHLGPPPLDTPYVAEAGSTVPISAGDVVIVSGTLGDHGVAMLAGTEGIGFQTDVETDLAPLQPMCRAVLTASPHAVLLQSHMHQGLAAELHAATAGSGLGVIVDEQSVPCDDQVFAACELLGVDALHLANAGKLVAIVPPPEVPAVMSALRGTRSGVRARAIGRVVEDPLGRVLLQGAFGGNRVLSAQPDVIAAMGV